MSIFLLWFALLAISTIITVIVLVFAILATMRTHSALAAHTDPEVLAVLNSAQRRALCSIGVAVAIVAAMFALNSALPGALGAPIVLAPTTAAAGSILFHAFPGQRAFRAAQGAARSASLEPRSTWTYVSKPSLWALILSALGLTGFLTFTGLTATTDDFGLSRAFGVSTPNFGSGGSPYPGWFYGGPLLIALIVLLAVTSLAHRRLSAIPAFPRADLVDIDRKWRLGSARIVSTIAITGILLTFGGLALITGTQLQNTQNSLRQHAIHGFEWLSIGPFITVAGSFLILGAMACVVLAALWAMNLKKQALAIALVSPATQTPAHNPYV